MKNKIITQQNESKRKTLKEILSLIDPEEIKKIHKEMDYFINMHPVGKEII